MKTFFALFYLVLVVLGFAAPVVWLLTLPLLVFAIGMAPSGKRLDSKRKPGISSCGFGTT